MEKRQEERTLSSLRDLRLEGERQEETKDKHGRGMRKNLAIKVQAEDLTIYERFKKVEKKNNKDNVSFIIKCLSKHLVFWSLMDDIHTIEYLIHHLFYCEVPAGENIIQQGDNASSFFILHKGRIEVLVNGVLKKTINSGEGFGELALLYNASRSATCRAAEPCELWGIDRPTFRRVLEEINTRLYTENRKFINDVKFFAELSAKDKDDIANILNRERYKKGDTIVTEGEPASSLYIIKSGEVRVMNKHIEVTRLREGEYFGENGLMADDQTRSMTIVAEKETVLLSVGRDSFNKVLGSNLHVIVFRSKIRGILSRSVFFSKLSKLHHEKLIDELEVKRIESGEAICTPGMPCRSKIFFVLDGEVTLDGKKVDHRNVFFGEECLDPAKAESAYPFTVTAVKRSSYAAIDFEALNKAVGGSFQEAVQRVMKAGEHSQNYSHELARKRQQMAELPLTDFVALKKLGYGQFGSVYLVASKTRKEVFALKCISKAQIVESKLEKHLANEKHVLSLVGHPLMLEYIRSYKDEFHIYFLMEYIRGMELFDVIREIGLLQASEAQFYVASMILCIEYLHGQQIIYRDLKPENAMVDQRGSFRLIDMGTCKIMRPAPYNKTYTIIGTPHYMAPEVLAAKGYSLAVDLWSIGVCLYEFIGGYLPFGDDAQDPYEIYEEIIKNTISYPKYVNDKKAKLLIEQLLSKVPEARLGGSFPALKAHSWFASFDWCRAHQDYLLSGKLKPPFVASESKMLNVEAMLAGASGARSILEEIRAESALKKPGFRKDLDPAWDKDY
ncbi:LOW QUALITY PROTEIN: cGMP-dependent protein kinase-like [Hippocampus zosterae]|uniref:LOW QUALITY PROTEIN: cGMP-dependent protein kinase-like n=1 Tax=Hippocampus zosterae TaxID=109293 RepID=UPI00223CB964|nr:LOW QUALITY PROTEIN: cGMP-dependent protein kinase-like [Hippocampus zosterae]